MKAALTIALTISVLANILLAGAWEHRHEISAVQQVYIQALRIEHHDRGLNEKITAWRAIDTSKCPRDFQDAWGAFLDEKASNAKRGDESLIVAGGDFLEGNAAGGAKVIIEKHGISHEAEQKCDAVMKKYGL